MASYMAKLFSYLMPATSTMVTSKMVSNMVKVCLLGQMVADMKVTIKMAREMAKVCTHGQMVRDMKVSGKIA